MPQQQQQPTGHNLFALFRQMPQQQQQPTGRNLFGGCQPGVECVLSFETPEEMADHIEQYH